MVVQGAFTNWVGHSIAFITRLMPLCRIFLHRVDVSFRLLTQSTSYFGYNPRRCFRASTSNDRLEDDIRTVETSIRESVNNTGDHILRLLFEARMGGSNSHVSHTVFQISPADKRRSFSDCRYGYVSRWALDVFLEQYATRKADAIAAFYRSISTVPIAGSLRGYLFEKQVLNYLCGIHDASDFRIRRLTDSNRRTWTCRGPVERIRTVK